jgi:hypothetical protein
LRPPEFPQYGTGVSSSSPLCSGSRIDRRSPHGLCGADLRALRQRILCTRRAARDAFGSSMWRLETSPASRLWTRGANARVRTWDKAQERSETTQPVAVLWLTPFRFSRLRAAGFLS